MELPLVGRIYPLKEDILRAWLIQEVQDDLVNCYGGIVLKRYERCGRAYWYLS